MNAVLALHGVSKTYDGMKAVDYVSFTIEEGEIVGLLGPNGAGKTSTINMVLGVLTPDAGDITIDAIDIGKDRAQALGKTNFVAVYAQVPGNLSVWQALYIFGILYDTPNLAERIRTVLTEYDLERFARTKVGILSSGEQTRVALAKAMLNRPRLLLLDEPTASLDPSSARMVRASIREYVRERKGAVLWTSHNMQEVAEVCDRVLFISHGRILLQGNPKTLPGEYDKENLEELFITVAREPLSLVI